MNDATAVISALPAKAARMLAVKILLADQNASTTTSWSLACTSCASACERSDGPASFHIVETSRRVGITRILVNGRLFSSAVVLAIAVGQRRVQRRTHDRDFTGAGP